MEFSQDQDMQQALTEAEILELVEMADETFDAELQELAALEFASDYDFDNGDYNE